MRAIVASLMGPERRVERQRGTHPTTACSSSLFSSGSGPSDGPLDLEGRPCTAPGQNWQVADSAVGRKPVAWGQHPAAAAPEPGRNGSQPRNPPHSRPPIDQVLPKRNKDRPARELRGSGAIGDFRMRSAFGVQLEQKSSPFQPPDGIIAIRRSSAANSRTAPRFSAQSSSNGSGARR